MPRRKRLYKVLFQNDGKVYELFAQSVGQSGIFGFVEIGGLQFGERGSLVVDPNEERLQAEFEGVERFHVPLHAVVRIDEVAARGTSRIHAEGDADGKVRRLPGPIYSPPRPES